MRKNIGYPGLIFEILPLTKEIIDKDLKETLLPREAEVLRHRFGLDIEPKTLEEVGENFAVSRERIRGIEFNALKKLKKKYSTSSFFNPSPMRAIIKDLQSRNIINKMRGILSLPITELELSPRVLNCFREANIEVVADLAAKSETDLLCCNNFGKKCLNEVKSLLEQLGLSLGMKLPRGFKHLLSKQS